MSAAKSSKAPAAIEPRIQMPTAIDWLIVVAILILTLAMIHATGSRRGVELMPWPDGLEYAAAAMNLAKGRGAVLHFGGYTYPSRYTAGYPLILEFFRASSGGRLPFFQATTVLAALSIVFIWYLARVYFGRSCSILAGLLLALSPVFITYSSLAMSDVPTLCVTLCAVIALMAATSGTTPSPKWARVSGWLIFGLLAGFSTIVRPTNVTILVGLAVCVAMVPLEKRDAASLITAAVAVAIGFAIPVAWQLHQNAIVLGSPIASGYAWWVPEVYGSGGRTFSASYLFGPTMPRNPYGNVLVYVTTLLGTYGTIQTGGQHYLLYPVWAAAFAIIGFTSMTRGVGSPARRRLMWFGLGYLGALAALYCFYIFTDVAFILPAAFILFIACGEGIRINREVWEGRRGHSRTLTELMTIFGVIVLDVMLVFSLGSEAAARLSARAQPSLMVESIESLNSSLPSNATVVSNISLQFLDLYLGEERNYVGLNSMDPGERFTDYHLHRLYAKRAAGWKGPVPPVVFDGGQMAAGEADAIASAIAAKTPVYVLVAAPESQQYADVLKSEIAQLGAKFAIEPVSANEVIAVYRLSAK